MTDGHAGSSARVFFALWPGAGTRAALAAWQAPLKQRCGGRQVPVRNLHLTLVFLGNLSAGRLPALEDAVRPVHGSRFDLTLDRARCWQHNHIAHAAPAAVPVELERLVHALEHTLTAHGFRFDRRPEYKPHVTLLRHANCPDGDLPALPPVSWSATDFVLLQSANSDSGVTYRVRARFPLR